jgi:hypothetical protein
MGDSSKFYKYYFLNKVFGFLIIFGNYNSIRSSFRMSSCGAKRITLFKLGKLWVFKHFFDDKETFKVLAENYNEFKFRFEFKTFGERNKALKILDRAGFDYELVEDLRPFVVKLSRYSKYAPLLKDSIAYMETPDWRIFLMKDLAAWRRQRDGCGDAPGRL